MKAQRSATLRLAALVLTGCLLTQGCAEQKPMPAPRPSPSPTPPPPPRAPRVDWRYAPVTPGDWTWSIESGRSEARFSGGVITLTCDRVSGSVTLARSGSAAGPVPMTILSSHMVRDTSALPQAGPPPVLAAVFPARDAVLDAMAFSRGRFALEVAGLPTLIVPSWPEIGRVVEDCR
jgi:DNA-binding transcriptional LysR family regulator